MNNIFEYIDKLANGKKRVAIWGAGETAKILFEITNITKINLLVVIDTLKTGEHFYEYIIKGPDEVDFGSITSLIITPMKAQEEISNILKNKYLFQGEIIKIYENDNIPFIYDQPQFAEYMQKVYSKRLKNLKDKDIIRIGYIASQNELWNLQSFYEEVEKNDKYYFEVIALPNHENILEPKKTSCDANYYFFKKNNINVIYGYDFTSDKFCAIDEWNYDILFWDQPGSWTDICKQIPFYIFIKRFLLCYVPYGYKVADGRMMHYGLRFHNLSWKIFAESEWHYKQFEILGQIDGKNVVITGFPKLDRYLKDDRNYSNWKHGMSSKKRVIWAPHWTFRKSGWEYSTFDNNYMEFLKYASEHKEIDWIVKPHQRLYFWAVESGLMTEKEMRFYFERWNALDNAVVCDGGNYMDMFLTSNALITDCGSFLAEYLPSKNPIIHLYKDSCKYNEIGNMITQTYYRCKNWEEVESTIERVIIHDDDYLRDQRLSMLKYVVPNQKGAGKAILKEISKAIM